MSEETICQVLAEVGVGVAPADLRFADRFGDLVDLALLRIAQAVGGDTVLPRVFEAS
ncbi:hypothetical protein [Salinicola tamaricis]|uniref:hypothetical protein n=1 Tax=Salinicola tamaricis TaxID=1771309 RepID=UPI0013E9C6AE|nr:hypothetical protein [Salinicola tamaricis]